MHSVRTATLCLGLGLIALGVGLLSQPDPEGPRKAVRSFMVALSQGDHVAASRLVEGGERLKFEGTTGTSKSPILDESQVVLDVVKLTSTESTISAKIQLKGHDLNFPVELAFYRGIGWKIRTIDGLRVDPVTLWSEIEQGLIEADPQYVDESRLKRDLEKIWDLPGERRMQIATEPDSQEERPQRF